MPLAVGSRLGHYDVTALIGEGGMGQVYQTTDTKLDWGVGLKVLRQALTEDPSRLDRVRWDRIWCPGHRRPVHRHRSVP